MNAKSILVAPMILLMLCCGNVFARSTETWICLKNETGDRKLILVEDVDSYDWDGVSRPDHNWNGTYVEAGQTRCERAELNMRTLYPAFGFIIDGAKQPHKVRMTYRTAGNTSKSEDWIVFVGSSPSLAVLRGYRTWSYSKDHESGKACMEEDNNCYTFTIRNVP